MYTFYTLNTLYTPTNVFRQHFHFLITSGTRYTWFHQIGEIVIPTECKYLLEFQWFCNFSLLGHYLVNIYQILAKLAYAWPFLAYAWPILGLSLAYAWLMLGQCLAWNHILAILEWIHIHSCWPWKVLVLVSTTWFSPAKLRQIDYTS